MHGRTNRAAILLTALAVCAAGVGCQALRIPAIDPSGRRLFLPPPNYTTLAGPSPATQQFGILPTPAWSAPPLPPPCLDAPAPPTAFVAEPECGVPLPAPTPAIVVPQGAQQPHREQLTLAPKSIIAPVGSEVVLVAGLCSGKGYYLKREPIDWTITRESVGQFVQVPNEHSVWRHLWNIQPEKRSGDLAAARTQVKPVTITRGNADPSDDVHVASGQSWVTVTSEIEGTSRVMAYSPGVDDWSLRKQTATIYWVDAQWQLPAPACVPAGQTHLLITRLTRSDGVTPICGYVVRYEVVGGPPVSFAPSGASTVDVFSDEQGNAAVEISQPPNQPGTSEIRISIIRPPQQTGDPTLTLGQGFTSLTWSAPGLALGISGPASAAMDSTVTYQINVTNPGDQAARDVVVSDVLPPGLSLISSEPPGSPLGDRLEWRLGDVSGFGTQTITLHCRATRRGDVQHCASARSADGLTADDCVTTRIFAPSLSLTMTGPETAEVGQRIEFHVEVTNTGPEPLRNVSVTDRFDAGLSHTEGERSPIERVIESIPAGQTVRLAVPFNVVAPGRLCHTLEAVAEGGEKAVASTCVTVTQPAQPVQPEVQNRPALQTALSGPVDVRVGELPLYSLRVTNTGNVPLTNVAVSYRYPASLEPKSATGGNEHVGAALIWRVATLAVGQSSNLQVQCLALRADIGAVGRVEATSDQNASHNSEFTTRISPAAAPPGVVPGGVPPGAAAETVPVTGNLTVAISGLVNPARVGQVVTYLVTIKNDRNVSDKDVRCSVIFPAGMSDFKFRSDVPHTVQIGGNTVELSPFAELRAGDEISFNVDAKPTQAGQITVRAQVKSLRSPEGVSDDAQTTVTAP